MFLVHFLCEGNYHQVFQVVRADLQNKSSSSSQTWTFLFCLWPHFMGFNCFGDFVVQTLQWKETFSSSAVSCSAAGSEDVGSVWKHVCVVLEDGLCV